MYQDLIHDLFPHRDESGGPAYRPRQFEVIRDTLEALDDDTIDDVVVEAPTGSGKTSVAVTVARVVTRNFWEHERAARAMAVEKEALEMLAWHQAHMITSKKMLQDAYLGDDPSIVLVKGKSNYVCKCPPRGCDWEFTCDDHEKIHGRLCDGACPYTMTRRKAQWAPIALHNFDSFLNQAALGKVFVPRRLLTLDEGHNAEEKLRGFMTLRLEPTLFKSLGLSWSLPKSVTDAVVVGAWVEEMARVLGLKKVSVASDLSMMRAAKDERQIPRMAQLAGFLRRIEHVEEKLDRFLRSRDKTRWVAMEDSGAVVLEPVHAGRFAQGALFSFGHKRLHLSATFLNGRGAYTNSVRMDMRRTCCLTVPSFFPAARRPMTMESAGNLAHARWTQNFPRVAAKIEEIMSRHHDVRGVIHCTSYGMGQEILCAVKNPRLVVYDKMTRDRVVGSFLRGDCDPTSVLVAVGLTEGYDFRDGLSRFQILVRLPYLVPTTLIAERRKEDANYYGWRTALTLVQTYGRGMRSANDWCHTYILDERFKDFVEREKGQLPGWFLEACKC